MPFEEHFILEKEEWRYDRFPEFYNGSNVLDFYDADIEEKLAKLEKEEDEILKMEDEERKLMDGESSDNSDGITMGDLQKSIKQVRHDKGVIKLNSKMKSKLRVHKTKTTVDEIAEKMEKKGIEVNRESLRSKSKTRRSIGDLEDKADKLAKKALDSSDEDGEDIVMDDDLANKEAEQRGRKRSRKGTIDSDDSMDGDDGEKPEGTKATKPKGRSMTPA